MEALPKMPMVAPMFRTSTLTYDSPNVDFRMRAKEYILMHFQADPHEHDEAFNELSAMKLEANNPSASVEGTCLLKRYYGQLCMIQKRFPMSPGQDMETPFSWYDSLGETKHQNSEIAYADVEFEKASVMFNIGAAHAQIGANESRETQDSIKNAFMHFQYAAFAFEKLRTERYEDKFYPSIDLDPNVLMYFQKIMLAQAQECLVQKSLLDNRSHIVIAKLAKWLDSEFEACSKLVKNEWNVNVSERVQKYHMRMCQMKSDVYATIAYLSMGDHSETETKKMGYRLAYFGIANRFLSTVVRDRTMLEKYPELVPTVSFLSDVVQAKLVNAEKENNLIYHELVPKEDDLMEEIRKDGFMCKVKCLAFDPLDRSVCGEDIFGTLLPPTVLQSVSVYEEKKAEVKRNALQDIQRADEELEKFLARAGYTDLRWMINEGKDERKLFALPDWLLERNAEMTSHPDAIPALLEKLRETAETSKVAEAKLNTLIAKLRAIDLPRLKNDEGYSLISKELDKLNEHLATARENTASLTKAIASHSTHLQILSLPIHELRDKMLTNARQGQVNRAPPGAIIISTKEELALKRVMNKIEEMRCQRGKLLDQLNAELTADDISKELLSQRDFSHDDIYEKEIRKHDETLKYIRLNMAAQENILHAFTEANADYCEERMMINKSCEIFNEQARVLSNSYDIFKDVTVKVAEGDKFYRQLMQRCDQFAIPIHAMDEEYRAEIGKMEREKREMDERMMAMRRQKEARDAMAEFGGGMPMGAPPPFPPSGAPLGAPAPNPSHPRLRDFLGQYRSSKSGNVGFPGVSPVPSTINTTFGETPILGGGGSPHHELPAPPSPTPSSVSEFPISPSVRNMARQAPPPSANSQYGAHLPGIGRHQQNIPTSQYRPAPSSMYQRPMAYQNPSPAPSYGGYGGYQEGQAPAQAPASVPTQAQAPGHYYQQAEQQGFQQPPVVSPIPPPHQQQAYQPHQLQTQFSNQSSQSSGHGSFQPPHAPSPALAPAPVQVPAPSSIPPSFQPPQPYVAPSPAPLHPQPSYPPQLSQLQPQLQHQAQPQAQHQAPPHQLAHHAPSPINPTANQRAYHQPAFPPQSAQHQHFQPSQPQYQPNHQMSASSSSSELAAISRQPITPIPFGNSSQPQPPQPPVNQQTPIPHNITGFGNSSQPQAQPQPPQSQAPAQSQAPPSFDGRTVNVGNVSSPWHAAPAQFKSSLWHVGVQEPQAQAPQPHPGPAPPAPATPQVFQQQQQPPPPPPSVGAAAQYNAPQTGQSGISSAAAPAPASRSNVDLLGDLLGDFNFNLAPPLQPTVHTTQNLQNPSDFRQAVVQPDPGKVMMPPPTAVVKRPAATVLPLPQQQQTTTSIATSPMVDSPILTMNSATSVSFHTEEPKTGGFSPIDITDPAKFELGTGHAQKLEKRLLHHSIRTNGPLPPLNPNDPLNQINAFGFLHGK